MLHNKLCWYKPALAVFCKDMVCEFRTRYALGVLSMFTLVTLSSLSISLGSVRLTPVMAAVFLWVIIFFSAMAGLSRVFVEEEESGTLFTLRVYAGPQAVLFGKLAFNIIMLTGLTIMIVPVFSMFFNMKITSWIMLSAILALGGVGIGAVATLTAALAAGTAGRGSLFTVLTFPIIIPQFLTAIQATGNLFDGCYPYMHQMVFMAGYDAAIIAAASLLFDYLWYD